MEEKRKKLAFNQHARHVASLATTRGCCWHELVWEKMSCGNTEKLCDKTDLVKADCYECNVCDCPPGRAPGDILLPQSLESLTEAMVGDV